MTKYVYIVIYVYYATNEAKRIAAYLDKDKAFARVEKLNKNTCGYPYQIETIRLADGDA